MLWNKEKKGRAFCICSCFFLCCVSLMKFLLVGKEVSISYFPGQPKMLVLASGVPYFTLNIFETGLCSLHPSASPLTGAILPTDCGLLTGDLLALTDGPYSGEAWFAVEKRKLAKSAPGPVLKHLCFPCPCSTPPQCLLPTAFGNIRFVNESVEEC
jgi:hypothetical protein